MSESDDERSIRRSALWRIHGLAAILGTPFLLVAAVTGLMYAFAPQIDAWRERAFERVAPAPWQPLDRLVDAATAAAPPGTRLRNVTPPVQPGDVLHAVFSPGPAAATGNAHGGHGAGTGAAPAAESRFGPRIPRGTIVHVDPGSGHVLGTQAEMDRYSTWAKRLHSSLLQDDGWRWMIEWAATCLLVLLLTGAALWWPRRGQPFAPRANVRGRGAWRQWHAFAGFTLALMSLAIVLTGLTWSRYAGDQVRGLRDRIGQAPPRAPSNLRSTGAAGAAPLSWQAVWDEARRGTPAVALQIVPPRSVDGVWRIFTPDNTASDREVRDGDRRVPRRAAVLLGLARPDGLLEGHRHRHPVPSRRIRRVEPVLARAVRPHRAVLDGDRLGHVVPPAAPRMARPRRAHGPRVARSAVALAGARRRPGAVRTGTAAARVRPASPGSGVAEARAAT